jgi:hypothetical protein
MLAKCNAQQVMGLFTLPPQSCVLRPSTCRDHGRLAGATCGRASTFKRHSKCTVPTTLDSLMHHCLQHSFTLRTTLPAGQLPSGQQQPTAGTSAASWCCVQTVHWTRAQGTCMRPWGLVPLWPQHRRKPCRPSTLFGALLACLAALLTAARCSKVKSIKGADSSRCSSAAECNFSSDLLTDRHDIPTPWIEVRVSIRMISGAEDLSHACQPERTNARAALSAWQNSPPSFIFLDSNQLCMHLYRKQSCLLCITAEAQALCLPGLCRCWHSQEHQQDAHKCKCKATVRCCHRLVLSKQN